MNSFDKVATEAQVRFQEELTPVARKLACRLSDVELHMYKEYIGNDAIKHVAEEFGLEEEKVAEVVGESVAASNKKLHDSIEEMVEKLMTQVAPNFTIDEHTREYSTPEKCEKNFDNTLQEVKNAFTIAETVCSFLMTLPKESIETMDNMILQILEVVVKEMCFKTDNFKKVVKRVVKIEK